MKCQNCGHEINDKSLFCGFCGAKIQRQDSASSGDTQKPNNMICPNCGNPIGADDAFCGVCGAKITSSAPSQNSAQFQGAYTPNETQPQDTNRSENISPEPNRSVNKKNSRLILIILVIVIAALVIIVATLLASRSTSNAKNTAAPNETVVESSADTETTGDTTDNASSATDTNNADTQGQSSDTGNNNAGYLTYAGCVGNDDGFTVTFMRTGETTATLYFENQSSTEYSIGQWTDARVELTTSDGTCWAYFGGVTDQVLSGQTLTYDLDFNGVTGEWQTADVQGVLELNNGLPANLSATDGVQDIDINIPLEVYDENQ